MFLCTRCTSVLLFSSLGLLSKILNLKQIYDIVDNAFKIELKFSFLQVRDRHCH